MDGAVRYVAAFARAAEAWATGHEQGPLLPTTTRRIPTTKHEKKLVEGNLGPAREAAVSSTTKPTPTLLGLPAELRNRIWTYALSGTIELTIERPLFDLPGITTACRQTLHESIGIFSLETSFTAVVYDCDGAFMAKWYRRIFDLEVLLKDHYELPMTLFSSLAIKFLGDPNWTNMLGWCKAVHSLKQGIANAPSESGRDEDSSFEFLDMASDPRVGGYDAWPTVEARLELMRKAVALKDSRWTTR